MCVKINIRGQSNLTKAASWPRTDYSVVFVRWCQCSFHLIQSSLVPTSYPVKRRLDPFIRVAHTFLHWPLTCLTLMFSIHCTLQQMSSEFSCSPEGSGPEASERRWRRGRSPPQCWNQGARVSFRSRNIFPHFYMLFLKLPLYRKTERKTACFLVSLLTKYFNSNRKF